MIIQTMLPQKIVDYYAGISDKSLDEAYGYGLSEKVDKNFGWETNRGSAARALEVILSGDASTEAIANAIHKGWSEVALAFEEQNIRGYCEQIPEEKRATRRKLANTSWAQLSRKDQEKDEVPAKAIMAEYETKKLKI